QCLAELQPLNSLGLDGLGYHSALTIGAVSVARLVGGSRQDIACAAIDSISRHGVNAIAFNRRNKTSMISATNRIAEGVIDYEFTRLRVAAPVPQSSSLSLSVAELKAFQSMVDIDLGVLVCFVRIRFCVELGFYLDVLVISKPLSSIILNVCHNWLGRGLRVDKSVMDIGVGSGSNVGEKLAGEFLKNDDLLQVKFAATQREFYRIKGFLLEGGAA